ncbi:hypothetical protein GCM10022393_21130 [Aquimarina addita]|uniref:Ankyrin repeat domain-containing protein n=1 Tax=Aquimarina addita TaxID=870485 RepID=A0ABP6UMN8_9FLAO
MDTIFDAIRAKNLNAVQHFLNMDASLCTSLDSRGSTPLLLATYYGLEEISKLILTYNPDVNAQDGSGNTALMGVSFKGYTGIAQLLINAGADVNIQNYNKASALIFAATFAQKEMIKLLIKNGADTSATDNKGLTAEMHAKNQGLDFLELFQVVQ